MTSVEVFCSISFNKLLRRVTMEFTRSKYWQVTLQVLWEGFHFLVLPWTLAPYFSTNLFTSNFLLQPA